VVVGVHAAAPMAVAYIMCLAVPSKLPVGRSLQLVVMVAAATAVAVALHGEPFTAACFAALICLMMAPINMIDNGLLLAVPAMIAVYLGSPSLQLDPAPTALWTLIGGGYEVLLMGRREKPALNGISAATAYRHSVTMAAAMALSVYLVLQLDVQHGYWVPMTMGFVLLPFAAETRAKARQRIVGTILGSLLALSFAFLLPAWAIALVTVPMVVLAVAYSVLGRYAQSMVVSTPAAVLIANLASREAEVQATVDRLVATLVGVLIAAGLAVFLGRADEGEAIAAQAAAPPAE
jgi:hypothetical protein